MDQQSYQRWWALHVRVALGENLSVEDQVLYDAGRKQLDQEENFASDAKAVRTTRARLAALESDNAQLRARNEQLNREIADVEAALNEKSRQLRGVGD